MPIYDLGGLLLLLALFTTTPSSMALSEQGSDSDTTLPVELNLAEQLETIEGYIRLTLVFDGKDLAVVGASQVEGPLITNPDLTGTMVYQITSDGNRIASGSFRDPRISRSLPSPNVQSNGDPIKFQEAFDFTARIAKDAIPAEINGKVEISVYAIDDPGLLSKKIRPEIGISFEAAAAMAETTFPEPIAVIKFPDLSEILRSSK